MIDNLFLGFFQILTTLANVLLAPINLLIVDVFPNLNQALIAISNLFDIISTYIYWAIDLFGLTPLACQMIIYYFTFILTVPVTVYVIKIAVKWYHYLMP